MKNKGIVIFIIAAVAISAIQMKLISNHKSECEKKYFGRNIKVEGVVDEEVKTLDQQISFVFRVKKVKIGDKVENTDFKVLAKGVSNDSAKSLSYGSLAELGGTIDKPSGQRNPGAFDYSSYLMQNKIYGVMYFNRVQPGSSGQKEVNLLKKTGIDIRIKIAGIMDKMPDQKVAALLKGILLGDTSDLDEETKTGFTESGTAHIMSVSGSNITFLVIPLIFLFKRTGFNRKVYPLLIIAFLIIYAFVTGFYPPVARAVIMASVLLAAQLFDREADAFTALAFSAAVIMLMNPYTITGASFQLSFAATLSILLFNKRIYSAVKRRIRSKIVASNLSVTLSVQLGILPLSAIYFSNISIIGILANLLIMPLIPVISVLGYIMITTGLIWGTFAVIIFQALKYPVLSLLFISSSLSNAKFAIIGVPSFPIIFAYLYYACLVFFFKIKPAFKIRIPLKAYIAAMLLIAVLVTSLNYRSGKLEMVVLDEGEADCIYIKSPEGRNILIDSGEKSDVVLSFLKYKAISKIDLLIGTHAHEDHIGGAADVINNLKVDSILLSDAADKSGFRELIMLAASKGISINYGREGDIFRVGQVLEFDILNPYGNAEIENASLNNSSLMLKLIYRDFSALLTGDCEKEAEQHVETIFGDELKSDIIKIGHHGSDTSTSAEFFGYVSPYAAIISVGRNNKFGHPSKAVTGEIIQSGARLYRTDMDGSVTITTDGYKIDIITAVRGK